MTPFCLTSCDDSLQTEFCTVLLIWKEVGPDVGRVQAQKQETVDGANRHTELIAIS